MHAQALEYKNSMDAQRLTGSQEIPCSQLNQIQWKHSSQHNQILSQPPSPEAEALSKNTLFKKIILFYLFSFTRPSIIISNKLYKSIFL